MAAEKIVVDRHPDPDLRTIAHRLNQMDDADFDRYCSLNRDKLRRAFAVVAMIEDRHKV